MKKNWETAFLRSLLVTLVFLTGCAGRVEREKSEARSAIEKVLMDQQTAWNAGDIDGFMAGYWQSEGLAFVGASGVTRSWQATLERYKRNYSDRAAMGTLTFGVDEITLLGPDAATVLGTWQLQREKDRPGGVFTLLLRRYAEGWKIVQDHTSLVEEKK